MVLGDEQDNDRLVVSQSVMEEERRRVRSLVTSVSPCLAGGGQSGGQIGRQR